MKKTEQNARELMSIFNHPAMTDPVWTIGKESRTRKPKKSKRNPAGKGKNAKKFRRRIK